MIARGDGNFIAYARSDGILHRDVKLSNLALDAKGHLWVPTFGLAKADGDKGYKRHKPTGNRQPS